MNQTWENGKKPSFEQNFGPFGQTWAAKNFFTNLAPSVTRYHDQLSSCTIIRKNLWSNLEKI